MRRGTKAQHQHGHLRANQQHPRFIASGDALLNMETRWRTTPHAKCVRVAWCTSINAWLCVFFQDSCQKAVKQACALGPESQLETVGDIGVAWTCGHPIRFKCGRRGGAFTKTRIKHRKHLFSTTCCYKTQKKTGHLGINNHLLGMKNTLVWKVAEFRFYWVGFAAGFRPKPTLNRP